LHYNARYSNCAPIGAVYFKTAQLTMSELEKSVVADLISLKVIVS